MSEQEVNSPGSLGLEIGMTSASDTGDVLNTPDFNVNFGDKIVGEGNNAGSSMLGGIVQDVIWAVMIGLIVKYVWETIK